MFFKKNNSKEEVKENDNSLVENPKSEEKNDSTIDTNENEESVSSNKNTESEKDIDKNENNEEEVVELKEFDDNQKELIENGNFPNDYIDQEDIIIETIDLKKHFKNGKKIEEILKGVNFKVPRKSFTTIVGPSGSGKTTILNQLSGLDYSNGGQILVDGKNIAHYVDKQLVKYRLEKLGFIFQSYNLITDLTVEDNLKIIEG